jgi:hypothetical protein
MDRRSNKQKMKTPGAMLALQWKPGTLITYRSVAPGPSRIRLIPTGLLSRPEHVPAALHPHLLHLRPGMISFQQLIFCSKSLQQIFKKLYLKQTCPKYANETKSNTG